MARSLVSFTASAADVPDGYNEATYQVQTSIDDGDDWVEASLMILPGCRRQVTDPG